MSSKNSAKAVARSMLAASSKEERIKIVASTGFNKSQRAMLAAYMLREGKREAEFLAEKKRAWIAKARKSFRPGERLWCHVCDGYSELTHAHHVLPLSRQYDLGMQEPDQDFVWLCPNHHILVHIYLSTGKFSELGCEKRWELDKGWEERALLEVVQMASNKEDMVVELSA